MYNVEEKKILFIQNNMKCNKKILIVMIVSCVMMIIIIAMRYFCTLWPLSAFLSLEIITRMQKFAR